jgi:prevent-host-death family protein
MQQIELHEAQQRWPQLLEAAIRGEEIVITRDNRPVARLTPVETDAAADDGDLRFGSAKGMVIIHDDFDEPLEDFKDYM